MRTRSVFRSAFSLVEIVIASAIFMTLMAALLEAMSNAKRYEAASINQDDLLAEADSTVRAIAADLAGSGWYFFGTANFNNAAIDRSLRYYPYVRGLTPATRGTAFPERATIDASVVSWLTASPVAGLSPWTPSLYPGWSISQVPDLARDLVTRATQRGLVIPSSTTTVAAAAAATEAADQLRLQGADLAAELVQPSNELIFLRGSTGPWTKDPAENDHVVPSDLVFFPDKPANNGGRRGSSAADWRNPGDQWSTANAQGLPVLFASSYKDDGAGGYVHRNNDNTPYGVQSWGAYLDDSSSGLVIRMQWETLAANLLHRDLHPGVDDLPQPDDLREFTYVLLPSPTGFGRLVRAHTVLASVPAAVLGVEIGDWITDPGGTRGYQIDKILSDDVVRVVWVTRRHDPSLGVNQVRMRITFARTSNPTEGGQRALITRQVDQVFAMQAANDYNSQMAAAASIDISPNNVPYEF